MSQDPDQTNSLNERTASSKNIVCGLSNSDTRFIEITLAESPKDAQREFEQTGTFPVRQARVIVRDKGAQRSYKGIASLDEEGLTEWTEIGRGQPRMIGEEFVEIEETVTSNPKFREAVQKRGADPDLAIVTA